MAAQWVANAEGIGVKPGATVAGPAIGVAPLMAGAPLTLFLPLMRGAMPRGHAVRTERRRAEAQRSRRHNPLEGDYAYR